MSRKPFANSGGRPSLMLTLLALVIGLELLLIVVLLIWITPLIQHQPSTPVLSPDAPAALPDLSGATASVPPTAPPSNLETTAPSPTHIPPTPPPAFYEGPIVYGTSVEGRDLVAYRLGTGPSARAIIGGIHGGYEWNTVDLVSKTLEYFQNHPELIPPNVTLYLIPCMNPDGYAAGRGLAARTNSRGVDLNRNWDYQWQITATHGTRPISAGSAPFSEPETAALRDFILERHIELAIFYHSAMGKIFSGAERSRCATFELAEMMSRVTGYPHAPEGVPGQITTGDAIDWLSAQGIATIEIELTDHQNIEWERNLRGILAFLKWSIPKQGALPISPPTTGTQQCITYTVQPGDTLSQIALQFGVSVDELVYINGLTDPDHIQIGQSLCIPAGGGE
jgi:LysM repeat protein